MARLMARIIIKLNQGGGDEIEYYSKTKFRKFKDLMSRKCFVSYKNIHNIYFVHMLIFK